MTSTDRAALEAQADRLCRRGELGQALGIYRALAQESPDDAALRAKLEQVAEMLQPMELMNPKASAGKAAAAAPSTLEERAEQQVASGDYLQAAALYRQALRERPDSELLQERLAQVFVMAQTARPAPAPPNDGLSPEQKLQQLLERLTTRRR